MLNNRYEVSLDEILGAIVEQETRQADKEYTEFLYSGVAVN